ncbi:cytochrome P450 2K1-like [Cynoglossus semilaevis]|nr:cytochrome P450 2K1-like [Cynoglossus semilaevis]
MSVSELFLQNSTCVSLSAALLVLLLVYLLSNSAFRSQVTRKEPPGPRPLPLLGNLLQLDLKRPYRTFLKLSRTYGSVFTVYLGPKKTVVLAGTKTVREALIDHSEEFGEREPMRIVKETSQGCGIIWSNGECWREMRRFALTNLRDYGMGRRACEDKIIEECQKLVEVVNKFKGEALDTTKPLNYAVSNIICSMVYGSRFDYDDVEFTSMVDRTNRIIQLAASPAVQLYNALPWIGRFFNDVREMKKLSKDNQTQTLELVGRLKQTLNPHVCRGLVDNFLLRQQQLEKSQVTNSQFHDFNLVTSTISLFAAGTDTTSTTLKWALLLMAKYPQIQDQVQDELNSVVGSRQVQVEDRKNLPFVDAVIHETQRLANIVPMSLPHRTSQDVTFQGYFIKKGTSVIPLLSSVLYDDSEWEDPHSFHPAHFLDQDGKFIRPDAFMPFSAGRRVCVGEALARMELFLFFSTLLQRFRFTPEPGVSEDDLDLTPRVGFTLSPADHKLCAVTRM